MAENNSLNVNPASPLMVNKGGTGLSATTVNQILYSSAINTIAGLATANSSVLVTGISGIPSLSTTLPSGLTIPGYATSGANSDITSLTGLTGVIQGPTQINDPNGNAIVTFTNVSSAVNYVSFQNGAIGFAPSIKYLGSDANITGYIYPKGDAGFSIVSSAVTTPALTIYSGTTSQHITNFSFANTANTRAVTFPDATGTITLSDTNNNISANNFLSGYATTVTAAGTTTLTAASAYQQYFTGTTTQTIILPDVSTLVTGFSFKIVNNSTQQITIQSYGANIVDVLDGGIEGIYTCILTSGTSAASWSTSTNNPGIAVTGTWSGVAGFTIYQASSFINGSFLGQINVATYDSTNQPLLTTLNLGSIGQLSSSFTPIMGILTSFNAPSLVTTLSDFSPTMALATTFSLPSLQSVGGSFSPVLASLTSLSLPVLQIVNTNFSPVMALMTTFSVPDLTSIGGNLSPVFASLTTFSLNSLTSITGTFGMSAASLTSFSMTGLTGTIGSFLCSFPSLSTFSLGISTIDEYGSSGLAFSGNELSTSSWSFPNLTALGGISINANITGSFQGATLSLPSLTTIKGYIGGPSPGATYNNITSLSLASLVTVGFLNTGIYLTLPVLTSLDLSSLTTCTGAFTISAALCTSVTLTSLSTVGGTNFTLTAAVLTSLTLPGLTSVNLTFLITAPNMTSFSMNSGLLKMGGNFTMSGMALDQTSVDGILVSLANLNGTGGTTTYSSKTVDLSGGTSATPSATGLAAKATLVSRSCTVNTN